MSLPQIDIQIQNGRLGQVGATDDGVVGLILQGVAAGSVALNTAYTFFSLAEAETQGFTSAYDTTNTVRCWKHIKEFYDEAGSGSELQVIVLAQSETYVTMFQAGSVQTVIQNFLTNANGRIKVLGVTRSPLNSYTPTITTGINAEIISLAALLKTFGDGLVDLYIPVRFVIEGRDIAFASNASAVLDLKTLTCNYMSVVAGDTVAPSVGAAVGLVLGRVSKTPVQRNIGRVRDGAIAATAIYFGTSTVKPETANGLVTALDTKGFIAFRKHIGRANYYFTDDPTTAATTDDYNKLARGRIIDKATRLAYQTYLDYIQDEILVNPTNGNIEAATAKGYQAAVERTINTAMTANSEISGVRAVCDPAQNVLSTNKICVDVFITPVGYAREICVKLGFENQSNF